MGLMEFVKDAGTKLFDWGKEDREQSEKLKKVITEMGLSADNITVKCDDDTVTLSGNVPSQEDREKIVLLVGNSQGVSKVDDQLTVSQAETTDTKEASTFHTVSSGDTLSKIAKKHYGDAQKYQAIFEANRPMLSDPDKIFPGQVLRIPQLN